MRQLITQDTIQHYQNPRVLRGASIGERQRTILSQEAMRAARDEVRTWPATPPPPW
ncbi:hypothetical protein [Halomonas sp. BC04]|uniref:hypothetical protein n=1 Tax=Halomonas sp. BC04 TaxID=1403540 RepID=UPI0003ED5EB2|nr:hypothetical protein [Halomonas sp. BC04]EWH02894.1 hypothetical protein Q427_06220 [Halomonas sp. BC04]